MTRVHFSRLGSILLHHMMLWLMIRNAFALDIDTGSGAVGVCPSVAQCQSSMLENMMRLMSNQTFVDTVQKNTESSQTLTLLNMLYEQAIKSCNTSGGAATIRVSAPLSKLSNVIFNGHLRLLNAKHDCKAMHTWSHAHKYM